MPEKIHFEDNLEQLDQSGKEDRSEQNQSELEMRINKISDIGELEGFVKENFSKNQKNLWKDAGRFLEGNGGDEEKFNNFLSHLNSVAMKSFNSNGFLEKMRHMKGELLNKIARPGQSWVERTNERGNIQRAQKTALRKKRGI